MSPTTTTSAAGFMNIAPLLLMIALTAILRLLTYPVRTVRATSLHQDVLNAAIRCVLEHLTIAQSRYLCPSTSVQYITHCEEQHVKPQTLTVAGEIGDISAHWIGSSDAETVVLYLHGGGYTQPASKGHFVYMESLVKDLNSKPGCRSFAVLIVAYTLAPEATHPTQLKEAVAVLSHLITHTGRPASDIFLSGDSAGGNLVLAVLSHLLHPHPDVPPLKLEQPLAGALLYSPWAGFDTNYPSFSNESLDILAPLVLRKWSAMFLNKANSTDAEADPGPVSGDAWTETCLNPPAWWHGSHQVVSAVFICYGSYEVLAGSIKELEKALKKGWAEGGGDESRVTFLEAHREAHVQPIVDVMARRKTHKSESQTAIEEWLKVCLLK